MFITLEGIDGSGKSTQSKEVAAALRELGYEILLTREPGGTEIGNQIRGIVLDNLNNTAMSPRAELLLFCASRAQLVDEAIRPYLDEGGIVICDRYADSTMAYQGYGHELDRKALARILDFATAGLKPDLTFYLDLDPEIGLRRRAAGMLFGEDWNRLDNMKLAFHRRVYKGYEKLIAADPDRWIRIDAQQNQEEVTEAILKVLKKRLPKLKKSKRKA